MTAATVGPRAFRWGRALGLTALTLALDSGFGDAQAVYVPRVTARAPANVCAAQASARRSAWGPVVEAIAMDKDAAQAALGAFQDSLERYLEEAPEDVHANYLLATTLGTRAEVAGGVTKMRFYKAFHDQVEQVLDIAPDHAGAQHLLGRLHAGILRVDRVTRFIAVRLFGGDQLGEASWDEARRLLEAGASGDPCVPDHHWELARVYADLGLFDLAEDRLFTVLRLGATSPRDENVRGLAVLMLDDIQTTAHE